MLDFHTPTLQDKPWVDEVFKGTEYFGCFYTFATLYLWKEVNRTEIAEYNGTLLIRGYNESGELYYMYPAGKNYDIKLIISLLREDAASLGGSLVIGCAEIWQCDEMREAFPDEFSYADSRDDYDYIYLTQNLIRLPGKKFHSKRNHISKFIRNYPDWTYENITDDNVMDCLSVADEWLEKAMRDASEEQRRVLLLENSAIALALRNRRELGLVGGLLRADGRVAAMTLGERSNDRIFITHFEKADSGYEGSYAMINNQFAVNCLSEYEYVNREEDVGDEGLRKAKLSYNPDILLDKYTVVDLAGRSF